MLLKRTGKWCKSAATECKNTVESCRVCMTSGEAQRMNKFSLSKLHRQFNDVVEIDVMHWGKTMMLHAVDTGTSYSELMVITNRGLANMLAALDKIWCLADGAPKIFKGDQEFNKKELKVWMKSRGCEFISLPSRRHNKTGFVERKSRVIKDALEKLDQDVLHAKLNIRHKLSLVSLRAIFYMVASCYLLSSKYEVTRIWKKRRTERDSHGISRDGSSQIVSTDAKIDATEI